MTKLITALLTVILLIANSAKAEDPLADADKAYKSKNYSQAIKLYMPLALKGDSTAQFF
jgi:hypothetical protein